METDSVDATTIMNTDSVGGIDDISIEKGTTDDVSQNEVTREVDIEAILTEKGAREYAPPGKEVTREVGIEQISTDKEMPQSSENEVIREVGNALIRLELDIACCSEKLINMNLLMMHVAAKENGFEVFAPDKEDFSFNSDGEAIEFDILSGIFDLEVKEMGSFVGTLEKDINNTSKTISAYKHLGGVFVALDEKLQNAEASIDQLQNQISELMTQSAKFQMILSSINQEETSDEDREAINSWVGDFSTTAKVKMQTSEQQRHVLRMLKKSLARELELKNELKECVQSLDNMRNELVSSQQEVMSAKEETASIYSKFLEADSASTVLMGISKELSGKLQLCQLKINSAIHHEKEMNCRLQEYSEAFHNLEKKEAVMRKLAEENSLESSALKVKVNSLEEQLKASESSLVNGIASLDSVDGGNELHEINESDGQVSIAESRAQTTENESRFLVEANRKLNEELDMLRNSGISREKVDSLEKQLREKDVQLQEAIASIEASQELQTMLYSSIRDMEILIEKLKSKVFEANARADSTEDKCIILSEGHAELNEEVNFLRGKLECLEASLQKAEETKRTTAKDINISTKLITDMVMHLAVERERLHKQLSLLMIDNRALADKLRMVNKVSSNIANHEDEEIEKANKEASDVTGVEKSPDDVFGVEGNLDSQEIEAKLETVRTIDAGRLNAKYMFSAILIALIAVALLCFIQPGNCPY